MSALACYRQLRWDQLREADLALPVLYRPLSDTSLHFRTVLHEQPLNFIRRLHQK